MEKEPQEIDKPRKECQEDMTGKPAILEEINIEELAVDGICGIY